ncbi:toll/interleukin-1 receptor domain-containing protein [Microlunatus panaciterrae]|nr:toll/interleukin-1 receptor domain-containing protein [Microlunatus panaciterrae]
MISYANQDRAAVEALAADIDRAHLDVWMDRELTGGQIWWDTILEQIRSCTLFIFALSPDSLRSRACASELDYAIQLRRPVLPVMVNNVAVQLAPPSVANAQIVDYRVRSVEAAIALVSAVASRPAPPALPNPLPAPPAAPISYMNTFREAIEAQSLPFKDQVHLVAELRIYLDDPVDREVAAQLLARLRRRPDVAESVGREIDRLLNPDPEKSPPRRHARERASPLDADPGRGSADRTGTAQVPGTRPISESAERSAPRQPTQWRIHLMSLGLVLVIIWDVLSVGYPTGPIVFVAAAIGGICLAAWTLRRAGRRAETRGLRKAALIWGAIWVAVALFILIAFLVNS